MAIIASGVNEWYRLCIKVNNEQLTGVFKERLDKYVQNEMQALNIMLHVVVNNEVKYVIYPPSLVAGTVWDVGFINAFNGEMMIVNALTEQAPDSRLELCAEYFGFYGYLSQKPNFRSSFGK